MRAYSQDLRERVIAAWESGNTQRWVAETYRVSTGTVKRYIKSFRETGQVRAIQQRRQQPRIRQEDEPALREVVAGQPQARLEEYCAVWKAMTGVVVSPKTMSRMLVRLGLRQKNDGGRTGAG